MTVHIPAPVIDLLKDMSRDERTLNFETLYQLVQLALEIAHEGREGQKIGTLFVVSDHERVLEASANLILDPLRYHPDNVKRIEDDDMRETAKELAQLDGAFIVSNDGVFLSACRYIDASSEGIELPLGLGSRHMAAASISRETDAIAIAVSTSSVVRIFDNGRIVAVLNN